MLHGSVQFFLHQRVEKWQCVVLFCPHCGVDAAEVLLELQQIILTMNVSSTYLYQWAGFSEAARSACCSECSMWKFVMAGSSGEPMATPSVLS